MFQFFKSRKTISLTDEELLQKYKETSDMKVLGELYQRYMELVYGVCLKYLKDSSKAEDAVMSIFEDLTTKTKRYEIEKFRPWLHVLTKNYCLMQLRKHQKSALTVFYDSAIMQSDKLVHPIDEEPYQMELRFQSLEDCMEDLPPKQKKCIELFYLKNQSYKDIADSTKEELPKIRSYIQNGRRNLRLCIEKKVLGQIP